MTCRCDETTWERDCALHELADARAEIERLEAENDRLRAELARRGKRRR